MPRGENDKRRTGVAGSLARRPSFLNQATATEGFCGLVSVGSSFFEFEV